ncbi:MAG: orotate phosphoribosyltransferase [Planctomycetes bacterium]|nr:orotate phosphoribosyltransferase [Planctomycetota bacterium]
MASADPGATPMLDEFRRLDAVQHGHFRLSSGLHSDTYVQCARILERPDVAGRLLAELARAWRDGAVDAVVGPAVGGILVAYELARALGARAVYMEREGQRLAFRRGFALRSGAPVLVAEDVVTTGGSAQEVLAAVREAGGRPVGVASLVDRSSTPGGGFDVPFRSLVKLSPPVYAAEECPLCRQGLPVVKPGTRPEAQRA